MSHIISALIGYLLGSIPFGLLLSRWFGSVDPRTIGSGNIGATNVLRSGNKKLAAATLLCDAFKGTIAVLVAKHFWGYDAGLVAGFFAFIGHLFPIWLKFKGGKGVATFIGVTLALSLKCFAVFVITWLVMAKLFKYSSLAALTAAALTPVAAILFGYERLFFLLMPLAFILTAMHHENIRKLLEGKESKIGEK